MPFACSRQDGYELPIGYYTMRLQIVKIRGRRERGFAPKKREDKHTSRSAVLAMMRRQTHALCRKRRKRYDEACGNIREKAGWPLQTDAVYRKTQCVLFSKKHAPVKTGKRYFAKKPAQSCCARWFGQTRRGRENRRQSLDDLNMNRDTFSYSLFIPTYD